MKNGVKEIQTAGYNGARTVHNNSFLASMSVLYITCNLIFIGRSIFLGRKKNLNILKHFEPVWCSDGALATTMYYVAK